MPNPKLVEVLEHFVTPIEVIKRPSVSKPATYTADLPASEERDVLVVGADIHGNSSCKGPVGQRYILDRCDNRLWLTLALHNGHEGHEV